MEPANRPLKPSYLAALFSILCLILSGCEKKTETGPEKLPVVSVVPVKTETIPLYARFPGTVEAIKSVELLARVEGFLIARNFVEGSIVNEGDLLYQIDPKPYQAALQQAQGQLAKDRAALKDARQDLERQRPLAEKDFISKQAFDNYIARVRELEGQVQSDQAAVKNAELDLGYSSVYAPFTGKIGYTEVNVGNLVTPDNNPQLTSLVQMDPIYVLFQPDSAQLTKLQDLHARGEIPVTLYLEDGSEYPLPGKIDSIDNRIDPETDTIKMRAIMPNPDNRLVPGEFLKVRISLGSQENALLIPQKAIDEQQGGHRVFIVDKDDTVTAQPVTLGPTYGELQVIKQGLAAGDQVVDSGTQKLKSGIKVKRQAPPTPPPAANSADAESSQPGT